MVPPDVAPNDPARSLADELRALNVLLQSTVVDDDQLADAASRIAALRNELTGVPRLRWYEDRTVDGFHDSDYADHTLFLGSKNALAVPMRTVVDDRPDNRPGMRGTITLNRLYEGPPGSVHGGYLSGLFDSLFGNTLKLADGPAVTGRLEVKYRKRTPLETPLVFHSWIEADAGRRLQLAATCHAGEKLTAEATALFVRVRPASMSRLTDR